MSGAQDPRLHPSSGHGLSVAVSEVLDELRGAAGDRVRLLALEVRQASRALVECAIWALFGGAMVLTGWASMWAAIGLVAAEAGMPPGVVFFEVMLINGVLVAVVWLRVRVLLRRLTLPASTRHMRRLIGDDEVDEERPEVAPADVSGAAVAPRSPA